MMARKANASDKEIRDKYTAIAIADRAAKLKNWKPGDPPNASRLVELIDRLLVMHSTGAYAVDLLNEIFSEANRLDTSENVGVEWGHAKWNGGELSIGPGQIPYSELPEWARDLRAMFQAAMRIVHTATDRQGALTTGDTEKLRAIAELLRGRAKPESAEAPPDWWTLSRAVNYVRERLGNSEDGASTMLYRWEKKDPDMKWGSHRGAKWDPRKVERYCKQPPN